jgi:hypothetical protein
MKEWEGRKKGRGMMVGWKNKRNSGERKEVDKSMKGLKNECTKELFSWRDKTCASIRKSIRLWGSSLFK